jgi:hypothetical protein
MKIGIGLGIVLFLASVFVAQHLSKPASRPITVPVIYTALDANGNGVRHAETMGRNLAPVAGSIP